MTAADPPSRSDAGVDADAAIDFDAFYRREIRSVVGLAYTLCGSRSDAEELAQTAFADAFRDWERIGRMEKPGAWVRRAVANRAVSRRRRTANEALTLVRLGSRLRDAEPAEPALTVESAAFFAEVRKLPARQAQVVALHYWEDYSVAEIADVLDVSPGTVKTNLHRARLRLAERLGLGTERTTR